MFDKIKELKENKFLKFLWNFIYVILVILVVLILLVVLLQRFSNNNFALGGFRIFNIVTGSMRPVYEVGDILLAKEVEPSEIKVGDDITYLGKEGDFADKIVTHRVISITPGENGEYKIITQGTANDVSDPEISSSQVKGKIIYKIHSLSFISKIVNNLYSMYFIVFIPIAIIIFINLRNIYRNIFEKDEDEDDDEEYDEEDEVDDDEQEDDEEYEEEDEDTEE